jgi:hypothetical protein
MKSTKTLAVFLLAVLIQFSTFANVSIAAETLLKTDFAKENFAKTIDFFDYVRAYAILHGYQPPPQNWHAYVYTAYVNKFGLKMLYTGLCNVSFGDQAFLTIPLQTFIMHYKTENKSRDALISSSFVTLLAFNDTQYSLYPNSPDRNDQLWASLSLGFNLQQIFPNVSFPSLCSKTIVYPLKSSNNGYTWTWGMKYTNLTALWWRTYISPDNHTYNSHPFALTTYDELTFNYTLSIDPSTHKATLTENYVIGRIRDLWIFWGWFLVPLYNHYNSTGCYMYNHKLSNETIYQFIERNRIKMSIIEFQNSVLLERNTVCIANGKNVTDNEVSISNATVSTYSDDGEKIFDASFGVKETYKLYNYTADPTESTYAIYKALTRTVQISGIAKNEALNAHKNILRYVPLFIAHMHPQMLEKAKETLGNITRASYIYAISYPNYGGYRVEHDPVYTAYIASEETPSNQMGKYVIIAAIIVAAALAITLIIKRRKGMQLNSSTRPK